MWPLFRPGAVVEVESCDDELRPGDVVLIRAGDSLLLHRLLRLDAERALTKGDANPDDDGWFPLDHILGRAPRRAWDPLVARASPRLGRWLERGARLHRRFL